MAIEIVKTDGESYVRASALTFIATIVRIDKLWNQQLSQVDLTVSIIFYLYIFFTCVIEKGINKLIINKLIGLQEMAIYLLEKETEAIVRREAVNLIKELYVHQKWS